MGSSSVSPMGATNMVANIRPFITRVIYDRNFYSALVVIFAILSFIFEYSQGSQSSIPQTDGADDYYYIVGFDDDPFFRQACISGLIISLPSGLDMIIDGISLVVSSLLFKIPCPNKLLKKASLHSSSFRMTYFEKTLFIIGLICLAAICFDPVRLSAYPAVLYANFLNTSTILTICPILQLLSRCAPTWRPSLCIAIGALVCVGGLLSSITYVLDPESITYDQVSHLSNSMFVASAGFFIFTCVMSAVNTYWRKIKYPDDEANKSIDSNRDHCHRCVYREQFRNAVIAAHSTSVAILMVLNVVWYWYGNLLNAYTLGIFIYINVAASSVVFIAEFRVRKQETAEVLLALLDSKKQYVRYISHELRTPMNAASLGLQYLTDRGLPQNPTPEEIDTFETLKGVQTACDTAVEILNDILCFEKLESGILELHKTDVSAREYIEDGVKLFTAQAKERDVTLICKLRNNEESEESSLLSSDTILVDKFKMDQVLRNLVSNAVKFSPRGGVVIVRGYFVPSRGLSIKSRRFKGSVKVLQDAGSVVIRAATSVMIRNRNKYEGKDDVNEKEKKMSRAEWSPKCAPDVIESDGKGYLIVTVTDTGAGISPENQQRLFKEVVQFNPEVLQAGGGSGFGLFISKGIVDLHDGQISVYSEGEGKGSTFTVKIPMTRKRADSQQNEGADGHDDHNGHIEHDEQDAKVDELREEHALLPPGSVSFSQPQHATQVERHGRHDRHWHAYTHHGRVRVGVEEQIVRNKTDKDGVFHRHAHPSHKAAHKKLFLSDTGMMTKSGGDGIGAGAEAGFGGAVPDDDASPLIDSTPKKCITQQSHEDCKRDAHDVIKGRRAQARRCNDEQLTMSPTYRLLVVDDSALSRKMLCKVLKAAGHECDEADDGQAAVDTVKRAMDSSDRVPVYDAILMDFMMPNIDGPTATKELRRLGFSAPIFGVTGNGLASDIAHFKSCGANDVLVKPFDLKHFCRLMESPSVSTACTA